MWATPREVDLSLYFTKLIQKPMTKYFRKLSSIIQISCTVKLNKSIAIEDRYIHMNPKIVYIVGYGCFRSLPH